MKIEDIVKRKNNGYILTDEEIAYVIINYSNDKINDRKMTSFLQAIFKKGMTEEETIYLTKAMLNSGGRLDLTSVEGPKADKHSTGGVGDKTTLIVGPIVAACGVNVAKMSGRALGFTGGTIDKLESIPGFKVDLSKEEFIRQVQEIKIAITSQTDDLVRADKKIYALRDVTKTVASIPLIASSIMSKKLATMTDVIVLDVKVGNGAIMKGMEEARELANLMIKIGKSFNRKMIAVISNMDEPLGYNVGNVLEIEEALSVLKNEGEPNLTLLCKTLATYMVMLAKNKSYEGAMEEVEIALNNGKAYQKFLDLTKRQGGNIDRLPQAHTMMEIRALEKGIVKTINTQLLGEFVMSLGAGRKKKNDAIDYTVGVKLFKKVGDNILKGEKLLEIYTNKIISDTNRLSDLFVFCEESIPKERIILEVIK